MWNEKEARERLRKSYDETKDLVLKLLTKEMNLENLSPTDCRIVRGVHLYLDVVNLQGLLDDAREDQEKLRKLLRALHVYQRVTTKLLYEIDGAEKVHFQGARLHAVVYKPYDTTDVKDPDVKRLSAARQFVTQTEELSRLVADESGFSFELEAGLESGETIATMNGQDGSRELLFVGEAANVAAKNLTGKRGVRFGPVAESLIPKLAAPDPLTDRWEKIVREEYDNNPISKFELFEPRERLDYDTLGSRTAKLDGASFFADLAGFTKLVSAAKDDSAKRELLRVLHAVRREMRQVVRTECEGDHIQYQGDRIQGLYYEAAATAPYICKAVEAGATMQSVIKICCEEFPTLANVGMTVGIDLGRVLVSQLGLRGNRDVVVLGKSTAGASALQDSAAEGEMRISTEVFDKLEPDLAECFVKDGSCYASTADAEQVGSRQESASFAGKVAVVGSAGTGTRVIPSANGIRPARSWGSD